MPTITWTKNEPVQQRRYVTFTGRNIRWQVANQIIIGSVLNQVIFWPQIQRQTIKWAEAFAAKFNTDGFAIGEFSKDVKYHENMIMFRCFFSTLCDWLQIDINTHLTKELLLMTCETSSILRNVLLQIWHKLMIWYVNYIKRLFGWTYIHQINYLSMIVNDIYLIVCE